MRISVNFSELKRTKFHEFAIRFFFGGVVTVVAGLIAKQFGPVLGGLFLAFPAIFPASATLLEKHERQKKLRAGIVETTRGKRAAGVDAFGAAQACVGLAAFAVIVWKFLPKTSAPLTLVFATAVWFAVSLTIWITHKTVKLQKHSGVGS
jgi:hypothetical protein